MKKLKLNFDELEKNFEAINLEAMSQISGGYDCIFQLLSHLSSVYGSYHSSSYYYDNFGGGDTFSGSDMSYLLEQNFYYSSSPSPHELNFVLDGNDPSSRVVAVTNVAGTGHAVTITGRNDDGTYQIYDPSTKRSYPVGSSDIISVGVVCGMK